MDVVVSKSAPNEVIMMLNLASDKSRPLNIIRADSLKEGLKLARNEFICYIGDGVVSTNILRTGMEVFRETPSYRKLSMISCATTDTEGTSRIYGYSIGEDGVKPKLKRESLQSYGVQIGYLGGAIIRTSSLKKISHMLSGNLLRDSYVLSVDLWLTGNRCVINPQAVYLSPSFKPLEGITFTEDPWKDNKIMISVRTSWYKEVIT